MTIGRWKRHLRWAGALAGAAVLGFAQMTPALAAGGNPSTSSGGMQGLMYFTRFCSPTGAFGPACTADPGSNIGTANVGSVAFSYSGGTFSIGTPQAVSTVPAADGIAYTPSDSLVVGGQFTGNLYNVDATNGSYQTVPAGTHAAFMIGISPDGNTGYIGSVGDGANDQIGVVNLNTMQAEAPIKVTGPDQNVDSIAFDNGVAYYTSSLPDNLGDFGSINLQTGVETQLLSGVPYAHGMVFDPWSGDLILTGTASVNGQNVSQIAQLNPAASGPLAPVSVRTVDLGNGYYDTFDLPWVDGQGHLFAAANDGKMVFLDYAASGQVGAASDYATTVTVASNLDDVLGTVVNAPQFVIWGANRSESLPLADQTIQLGGDYNFWGHSWWKQIDINNPGGTFPYKGAGGAWPTGVARFKGFADQSGWCGSQWTARPGNSSFPPTTVGKYVSVIVTSNMWKSGSTTGGNIQEIVLLRVDDPAAYAANPGHPMNGTMVGVICKS